MASIIKRGKGRTAKWCARIFLGRDAQGVRRYTNKSFRTEKEAKEWAAKQSVELRSDKALGQQSDQPLADYLARWLKTAKGRVRPKTYDGYHSLLHKHVIAELGKLPLSEIHVLDVQRLFDKMAESYNPRYLQYTRMVLRQALQQAITWGLLRSNPCQGVKLPRLVKKEMQVLGVEQARRFLAVAEMDTPRWAALFSLALTTGMRPSEYLGLRWADINFDKRTLKVQRSLERHKSHAGGWAFAELKTRGSRRAIHLHTETVAALERWRAVQAKERAPVEAAYTDHDLVFPCGWGTPLQRGHVKRRFRVLLNRAGLPTIRLYDLRHTAATLALAAGVPTKVVSEMLGHASASMTLNVYQHVLPHMQAEAVEKVAALLREPVPRRTVGVQGVQTGNGGLPN